jgi:hypothetical protein
MMRALPRSQAPGSTPRPRRTYSSIIERRGAFGPLESVAGNHRRRRAAARRGVEPLLPPSRLGRDLVGFAATPGVSSSTVCPHVGSG